MAELRFPEKTMNRCPQADFFNDFAKNGLRTRVSSDWR
jgi:hypothetical protein